VKELRKEAKKMEIKIARMEEAASEVLTVSTTKKQE